MSGMDGVEVETSVGVDVADGVTLGVNVAPGVAVSTSPTGTPARDVWVAPATMVDITAVPRKLRSSVGAGLPGTTHAREASNKDKAVTDKRSDPVDKRMGVDFRIIGLLPVIKAIPSPKTRNHPPAIATLTL